MKFEQIGLRYQLSASIQKVYSCFLGRIWCCFGSSFGCLL